jgi:ATP-dependent Lon protease
MATAMASLLTGRRVRSDVSMTGEITLSGLVFPIGGLKEKVLAAHRAGIRHIIFPKQNESALEDIPEEVRNDLTFTLAERISDVLEVALEKEVTDPVKQYDFPEIEGDSTDSSNDPLVAE